MIAQLISLAAENGCQIICESHSDHVINGVRVAAKKGLICNYNIGVVYFSKNENQETRVNSISVDRNGNLSDYPPGLLDEWGILMTELIEIVLPWTDEGYGLIAKTTGRTIAETKKIAEIIEEEFGYI